MDTLWIDIQTAAWYEWTLLSGIGEARARKIVEYRKRQGGFSSLDDLGNVPSMPRGWVEKARPFLRDSFAGRGQDIKNTGKKLSPPKKRQ